MEDKLVLFADDALLFLQDFEESLSHVPYYYLPSHDSGLIGTINFSSRLDIQQVDFPSCARQIKIVSSLWGSGFIVMSKNICNII